jgi:hypothetical protein
LADSAALAVRELRNAYGDQLETTWACDACGETLELTLPLAELSLASAAEQEIAVSTETSGELVVRSPTTRDLVEISGASSPAAELLERCVRDRDGRPCSIDTLTDQDREVVETSAEQLTGLAALVVRTRCSACDAQIDVPVDAVSLWWEQVCAAAGALMSETARLARAFGWSEADIVAMTPLRRQAYLALAES